MKARTLIGALIILCMVCSIAYAERIYTLNKVIELALKNNTLLKEAIYNQKAALEGKKSALSNMFPKISADYNYVHLRDEPFVYFKLGPVTQKFVTGYTNAYSWDVSIVQPIFTGFALISQYEMASLGLDKEKYFTKQAKLDVVFEVKRAYLNVLMCKKKVEVMEEEVKQLKSHLEDAKNFYGQGIIPKNDLLKSEVAYALSRQKLVKAKSELEIAKANLNRIIHRNIQDLAYSVQDIQGLPIYSKQLKDLIKEALKNRPEIFVLDRSIKQAKVAVKLARSRFFPTISLFGKFERQGDDIGATENRFTNEKNLMVGINAKWEFFESGKKFFDVKKAKYQLDALEQKKETVQDQISLQVKKAYEDLIVARTNVDTARRALEQAKENFRVTDEGYKVQVNTSTDVLDARTYLTESEMNYYVSLYGYHLAIAALHRAIGEY